jgi:hypothetical protein
MMGDIVRDGLGAPKIIDRSTFHQIVTHKACLDARREQWDSGRCAAMISSASGFVHSAIRARREPPKASADCLLHLAAAPIFAIMALLTWIQDGGMAGTLCAAAYDASPLTGMVPMYLLMSAFHSAPWLKLVSGLRSGARRW